MEDGGDLEASANAGNFPMLKTGTGPYEVPSGQPQQGPNQNRPQPQPGVVSNPVRPPAGQPEIIPSPRGMGGDLEHQQQYGNLSTVRSGLGPTQMPTGTLQPEFGPVTWNRSLAAPATPSPTTSGTGTKPVAPIRHVAGVGVNVEPNAQVPYMQRDRNGDWSPDTPPQSNLVPGGALARPAASPPTQPTQLPQVPQHGPNLESAKPRRRKI
jgi:hypothetical protein